MQLSTERRTIELLLWKSVEERTHKHRRGVPVDRNLVGISGGQLVQVAFLVDTKNGFLNHACYPPLLYSGYIVNLKADSKSTERQINSGLFVPDEIFFVKSYTVICFQNYVTITSWCLIRYPYVNGKAYLRQVFWSSRQLSGQKYHFAAQNNPFTCSDRKVTRNHKNLVTWMYWVVRTTPI